MKGLIPGLIVATSYVILFVLISLVSTIELTYQLFVNTLTWFLFINWSYSVSEKYL